MTIIKYVAGENLERGQMVRLGEDGKIYAIRNFRIDERVRSKLAMGNSGVVVGPTFIFDGRYYTPVLWDGNSDLSLSLTEVLEYE